MTTIGAGWLKQDKNENMFISTKFDEAILPFTVTAEKMLVIRPNKGKQEPNQPDYYIDIFVPKRQEQSQPKTNSGFPE